MVLEDFSGSVFRDAIGDPGNKIWVTYTGTNPNQSGSLNTSQGCYDTAFTGPVTATASSGPYPTFDAKPLDTYAFPNGYAQTYVKSGTFIPSCNRLGFWARCSQSAPIRRGDVGAPDATVGGDDWQLGTYCRNQSDTNSGNQGQHYYHLASLNWFANRWRYIEINRRPQHEVAQADDWTVPEDPEFQGPLLELSPDMAPGPIVSLVHGSTTVTVTSSPWSVGSGSGWPLYFGTVSGQMTVAPSAAYFATAPASGTAGGTFTLTTPFTGTTAAGVTLYRAVPLPTFPVDGGPQVPTHYMDGITRIYVDFAPYGTAVSGSHFDGCVISVDDFIFGNDANSPDGQVATVHGCHTTGDASGQYQIGWAGRVNVTDVYDVYYSTSTFKNTDGTLNGNAGTHGGTASSPGSTYVCCQWDSPTMAEAAVMYFLIVPQGQSLGYQLKMIQRD